MTARVAAESRRAMSDLQCLTGDPLDRILEGRVRSGKGAEEFLVSPWRTMLVLTATLATLAGCARSTSVARTGTAVVNRNFCPKATATLYVTNDGWADVVIYLYRGSSRYRLGDVTGVQSAVFPIPETMMGAGTEIAVFVDPIGSNYGFNTGSIPLQPGHTAIDLRVANIINQSSFSYGVEAPDIS